MRILFLGDVVGDPGIQIIESVLPEMIDELHPDLVIANAENAASQGRGITRRIAERLFDAGVEILTMGNHVWDHKDVFDWISDDRRVVRPANYPSGAPGQGVTVVRVGDQSVGVVNLLGRALMANYDCPFRMLDQILDQYSESLSAIFVDFHAETTSEKVALAWDFDGRVSAIVGTHTHVQTADECILPGGSAYITDVGMTGPYQGVLGMRRQQAIERFRTQMPVRLEVADGPCQLSGVVIDLEGRRASHIERVVRRSR